MNNTTKRLTSAAYLLHSNLISSMYWSNKAFAALADVNFKMPSVPRFNNKQDYVQWHFEQSQHVVAGALQSQLAFIASTLHNVIK